MHVLSQAILPIYDVAVDSSCIQWYFKSCASLFLFFSSAWWVERSFRCQTRWAWSSSAATCRKPQSVQNATISVFWCRLVWGCFHKMPHYCAWAHFASGSLELFCPCCTWSLQVWLFSASLPGLRFLSAFRELRDITSFHPHIWVISPVFPSEILIFSFSRQLSAVAVWSIWNQLLSAGSHSPSPGMLTYAFKPA